MKYDFVIVGAGLAGSVLAELITRELSKTVLLVEKRQHIAGNCYDCFDNHGVLVHQYGPHTFHTNKKEVWEYLSRFTQWHPYQHRVKSFVDGRLVPFPINLDTINMLYGLNLTEREIDDFLNQERVNIPKVTNAEEFIISKVGRLLYEKLYKNYTLKQWGQSAASLSPEVFARIPVRTNHDDRYFSDLFQGLPDQGYTVMVQKMLDHPKISLQLETDYKEIISEIEYRRLIYTGPLDYFFDYRFGKLEYNSQEFVFENYPQEYFLSCAAINYPNDFDFTRIREFKYMTGQKCDSTTILKEYPRSMNKAAEPMYPVLSEANMKTAEKYRLLSDSLESTYFVGRLAEYRYYDMDQVVARALDVFERIRQEQSQSN